MLKIKLKFFITGFMFSLVLVFAVSSYAYVSKKVNIYFNAINVKLNEKKANVPNILYDGHAYIQLKEISLIFGKNVSWDEKNKIAHIDDKTISTKLKKETPTPTLAPTVKPTLKSTLKPTSKPVPTVSPTPVACNSTIPTSTAAINNPVKSDIGPVELSENKISLLLNEDLGYLSETYESNGDPGIISTGTGDSGGKSYGTWQISSKAGTLNNFLNWLMTKDLTLYSQLNLAYSLDENNFKDFFDSKWVEIANKQSAYFNRLQWQFIKDTHYDPVVKYFDKNYKLNFNDRSFTLQNVVWSTAVQHGVTGAEEIIKMYINLIKDTTSKEKDRELIISIYDERKKVDIHFKNCSTKVKNAVLQRFKSEKNAALEMLDKELKI